MLPNQTKTIFDFNELILESHIKAVLLDFDNTFYEYEPCHTSALTATKGKIETIVGPVPNFDALYKTAQKQVKERILNQAAGHSRVLYFQALFENLGRNDGHLYVATLEENYWQAFFSNMKITSGLEDFLVDSRKNGKKIVIVSDLTTTIQCRKLLAIGLADKIDYLVTSEEAGAEKPDKAPFLLALKKAVVTAEESVMIGDSVQKDIAGAAALGIKTILFSHDKESNSQTLRQ